jgi:hypothetical protein
MYSMHSSSPHSCYITCQSLSTLIIIIIIIIQEEGEEEIKERELDMGGSKYEVSLRNANISISCV